MNGPPLLLVGCWSSSRWVVSGWWGLRREKSIILSFNLQITAQHPGGEKAWSCEWIQLVTCFCWDQSYVLARTPALPYNPTSPLPASKMCVTCPFWCLKVLERGWLALPALSIAFQYTALALATCGKSQRKAILNYNVQVTHSTSLKKRKDAIVLGTCQSIQQISETAVSDDNRLGLSICSLYNKWSQTDAKAYLQWEHKAISLYLHLIWRTVE